MNNTKGSWQWVGLITPASSCSVASLARWYSERLSGINAQRQGEAVGVSPCNAVLSAGTPRADLTQYAYQT